MVFNAMQIKVIDTLISINKVFRKHSYAHLFMLLWLRRHCHGKRTATADTMWPTLSKRLTVNSGKGNYQSSYGKIN